MDGDTFNITTAFILISIYNWLIMLLRQLVEKKSKPADALDEHDQGGSNIYGNKRALSFTHIRNLLRFLWR